MAILKTVFNRIYSDYLMSSRLDEYSKIIEKSLENGYEHISIKDYYDLLSKNRLEKKKYFLHRHDIDTDVKTAKKMFEIEKRYDIKSTFYFRKSTLDIEFMKDINEYGSEASYHYEEIAQYCKDNHIKSKEVIDKNIDQIRELFLKNFFEIEKQVGYKFQTISDHGDFVNRKLKLINKYMLNDDLRKIIDIKCEAYDRDLMDTFDIYLSDKPYPIYYKPENIFDAIKKYNTICMLTHPRQWNTNWIESSKDNLNRLFEGISW